MRFFAVRHFNFKHCFFLFGSTVELKFLHCSLTLFGISSTLLKTKKLSVFFFFSSLKSLQKACWKLFLLKRHQGFWMSVKWLLKWYLKEAKWALLRKKQARLRDKETEISAPRFTSTKMCCFTWNHAETHHQTSVTVSEKISAHWEKLLLPVSFLSPAKDGELFSLLFAELLNFLPFSKKKQWVDGLCLQCARVRVLSANTH